MSSSSMNGGDGEHSYSSNSDNQRNSISKTQPIVEENIREMLLRLNFPKYCIKVADLGCSSGQNTCLVMFEIVNTITRLYNQKNQNLPEIDYCLNDLPENDFNTTFKLFSSLNKEGKGNCFLSGVPGSFYSRLFPTKSLHFLHSSYSLHWLSKVPQGLEYNKKNIYIRSGCSLNVCKSYMKQFQNDFFLFLRLRSEEMLSNGRMVLTFLGKQDLDPLNSDGHYICSLLSDALVDLVSELRIYQESDLDSFNLPLYKPNEGEVRETHERLVSFKTGEKDDKDDNDDNDRSHRIEVGKKRANITRSMTEPMLVAHFGDTIIDRLFDKFAHHATQNYASFPRQT
ncbi:hypothetical protein EUTSA_v10003363mg, partial [Eutrema salsugineum]